jgi:hypothetical protein
MEALRIAADDDTRLEGWLVPFRGHLAGDKDSYQTRFTAQTEYALDWFPAGRPLLYSHGIDPDTGITPVGRIDSLEIRDAGIWMQAQLDKQNEYFDAIRKMVKDGKLFLSSGSVEHLVQVDARSGDMIRWPIVEGSLTTVPANLYATVAARSAQEHYEAAGLPVDDAIRAVWSQADQDKLPNSSFAYVEPNAGDDKSKRHLPYKDADGKPDAAHVKAALSRLDQTDIPASAKASAKKKLQAAAKTLGIEVADSATKSADVAAMRADPMDDDDDDDDVGTDERSFEDICSDLDALLNPMYSGAYTQRLDTFPTHVLVKRYEYGGDGYAPINDPDDGCTYWDIPYTIGANLEPVLGAPVQVEHKETYTPVARAAELPFGFDAQLIQRHAATFARTTEEYGERRFREGRVLSGANMQTLSDTIDGMQTHVDTLRDLHKKASAKQEEAARAALYADPEWVRVQLKLLELAAV